MSYMSQHYPPLTHTLRPPILQDTNELGTARHGTALYTLLPTTAERQQRAAVETQKLYREEPNVGGEVGFPVRL